MSLEHTQRFAPMEKERVMLPVSEAMAKMQGTGESGGSQDSAWYTQCSGVTPCLLFAPDSSPKQQASYSHLIEGH